MVHVPVTAPCSSRAGALAPPRLDVTTSELTDRLGSGAEEMVMVCVPVPRLVNVLPSGAGLNICAQEQVHT
jgi:hypothetical protein